MEGFRPFAVAAILMGGAGRTPDAGVLRAAADSLTLNLRLTVTDSLPPPVNAC